MRRVVSFWAVMLCCVLAILTDADAWPWGPEKLVAINSRNYTIDDFKNWWANWKEKDTPFPASLDSFIDWQLLVQEAEKMELYNEPEYLHKIDVFLKARTLLLYRGDKINSKIKITDNELKDRYEKEYLPRFNLQILYFNDEGGAKKAFIQLKSSNSDVAKFAADSIDADKNSLYYEQKWLRIDQLPPQWRQAIVGQSIGNMSDPIQWSKGFVIIRLNDQKGYEPEDYERLKPMITNDIRKIKEKELTNSLIEELKKRYQVKINQPVYDALDLSAGNETLLDQPLITMDNTTYTVKVFLDFVNREQSFRKQYGFDIEEGAQLKKRLIDVVLAQTLTTRGALDEHYEAKEPLKPHYLYYVQHRLIKELDKRLFRPQVKADNEDIEKYYQAHQEHFSLPEMVSIAVIEDEEKLINKMGEELKSGSDLLAVAAHYYADEVPVQNLRFRDLDPVVQSIINNLSIGETSKPFMVNGHYAILQLLKRTPSIPQPLDQVLDKVAGLVDEEKYEAVRHNYIAALRARSVITINDGAWEKIKKELGDLNVRKAN